MPLCRPNRQERLHQFWRPTTRLAERISARAQESGRAIGLSGFSGVVEGENPSSGQKSLRGGALSPQFCDNVNSVAMAILSIDAGRKVREKTWPGIECCIKLRSGLYGIHSAVVGVKGL